jgi:alginate O-acetyltransferase complex protein AlgJ
MMATDHAARLNANEERSQHELASTDVSPGVARAMSLAFVAILAAVPLLQSAIDLRAQGWVQALDVFTRRPTREALHAYEDALESTSAVKRAVQPRVQAALTAGGRVGNDRTVLGEPGWLFYQPGIDYVTGAGFLDDALIRLRATRMLDRDRVEGAQPDPRPALRALHDALAQAGIRLLLVPVPDKAAVEASRLSPRVADAGARPGNPHWPRFVAEMRAAGLDVFDVPRPAGARAAYLEQDTHWTPQYMQQVAEALAQHLPDVRGRGSSDPPLRIETATVTRVGDLVDMLRLPPGQRLYAPQRVEIARVVTESGASWTPSPDADVLLVGDSFTNIYSDPGMGWGDSAGFAEHLSLALGRPLDVLAENGGAAAAVRLSLARAENRPRLAGKRLVIYQFAMRDLAGQHWPVVRLELPAASEPPPGAAPQETERQDAGQDPGPRDEGEIVVEGTIVQTSRVPDPATAPYASSVGMTRISVDRVVSGQFDGKALVAAFLVMRDRTLLPAARYTRGDRVRLRLVPFSRAGREIRGLQRSDDIEAFDLRVFWTLEEARR